MVVIALRLPVFLSSSHVDRILYKQGGIARFYKGIVPALIQGPACRFGDTAANAAAFTFLDAYKETRDIPVAVKTAVASAASAVWRILLMPLVPYLALVETLEACLDCTWMYDRRLITFWYSSCLASTVSIPSSPGSRWRGSMVCVCCTPR